MKSYVVTLAVCASVGVLFGLALGRWFIHSDSGIKVDLAPNGMAYCPADTSTPHPTPCMFRQP